MKTFVASVAVIFILQVVSAQTDDRIYVASANGAIEEYNTNGIGTLFSSGLGQEMGVAVDSAGNVYVVDEANNLIEKYDTNGVGTVFLSVLSNSLSTCLAIDALDNVYVEYTLDRKIYKFSPAGGGSGTVFAYGEINMHGMAFDASGNLLVADWDYNHIVKFDTNGNSTVFASANIDGPLGIAIDAAGNVYVANNGINTIERFSASGNDLGVFANTDWGPQGLAFDSAGNLYVTTFANTIQKVAPDGTITQFVSSYPQGYPAYLAIWPGLKISGGGTVVPTVSGINITGNQFQFDILGTASTNYIVQATTNLAPADWIPVFTNTAPFTFVESNLDIYPQRYYRVVSQ